ncbi:NUDIX domain-containing protein [Micromonospora sp. NPDC049580]|uniref:NUDIX hydrolase n=1 Tax=Micromonospora sp. NPDC049580 TaxID=3154832 RepID=UPI003428726B
MIAQRLRVAAYAVCTRDEHVLLARFVSADSSACHWTLPGGGVEHAEDPYDAVVREVAEETGYQVRVEHLLGVHSRTRYVPLGAADAAELHMLAIYYRVRITGGDLRHETGGSTDRAQWTPLASVAELERSVVVDAGLALHRGLPPSGHVPPIEMSELLRH